MNKLNNSQKINKITMYPSVYTRCELGQDYYKSNLKIIFIPDKYYPDYTELQNWLMQEIDGKTLNIEDVISIIYEFLSDTYNPKELYISNYITDCRTHFDVLVEK